MFGALNRFISRLDSDSQENWSGANGSYGFQVLRNTKVDLALEPWFDFIVGINGRNIDNPSPELFAAEIRNCAGATGQRVRDLYLSVPSDKPSLGLSLQWAPMSTTEDVWHILDVIPNSPADFAGLLPYGDYVIGSPEGIVRGENGLGELVEDFLERPLRLYVYNHEYDVTRPVTITPSRTWGGTGALGCVLGYGALHRIPAPLEEPPNAPGETLFENNDSKSSENMHRSTEADGLTASDMSQRIQMVVPATMQFEKSAFSASNGPPKDGRRTRNHHGTAKAGAMDDYFKEGEEKSRAEDTNSAKSKTEALPPPPKGGPPKAVPPAKTSTLDDIGG